MLASWEQFKYQKENIKEDSFHIIASNNFFSLLKDKKLSNAYLDYILKKHMSAFGLQVYTSLGIVLGSSLIFFILGYNVTFNIISIFLILLCGIITFLNLVMIFSSATDFIIEISLENEDFYNYLTDNGIKKIKPYIQVRDVSKYL